MAKIDIIQTSFAGGELGPSLAGRTDISQYQNACEIVQNFLIRPYGSAISAPGTKYVATVSESSLRTRVIPFVFNKNDSYILEMGDKYMRFFTNRGQVIVPGATEDLSAFSANLVAHWKCNDNTNSTVVLDDVGAHNATASVNTATISTTGKVGQAFNLAGANYVYRADHDAFTRTASTQPLTILAWVYYTPAVGNQQIFSKWDATAATREYQLVVNPNGQVAWLVWDSSTSGYNYWLSAAPLAAGWNFVVVAFQGDGTSESNATLYVNNVPVSSSFVTVGSFSKMANTTGAVGIGCRPDSGAYNEKWNDKIDNVAFLNTKLSAAQIASIFSTTIYQLATVFLESEIFDVQFAQLNDVIYLTHPNHPPQKLVRTAADEWAIADFDFKGGPFLDDNTTATTITPSATTGTINLTVTPTTATTFTVSGSTLGHHNAYFKIGGLAQTNSTTLLQEEGYVKITHVINAYTATATVLKNLKAITATAQWAEGAWSSVRGYPSCVRIHERRLWFARTNHEPQKIWGSKVYEFDNYALDTEADDDALNLALASNESNEIQWLASMKSLIAGTFGGAFVVNSKSSEPITPSNATAAEEIGIGTSSIVPKKIGHLLQFIQRFKKKLREMFYFWDLDTYKAADRTILSPHILGDGVVDMDVQNNPDMLLYCVLSSGTLAILTREIDQDFAAWSKHTTNGTYTSIAVIPSQAASYDEAWVVVERWINGARKKYIEYFENIEIPDRQDQCLFLHSALTYDAYQKTSLSSCTISLAGSTGSITLTSSTAYFVGTHVNKRLRAIDENGSTLGEGVITATASTTSITLSITTTFNALSYATGRWGISVVSVSGMDHLEAKTTGILADGITESLTRTVASGVLTLGSNYFVVHAGLSYDQIIYTLPQEKGSMRGTSQGKFQRYNEILFKLNRSTQNFKYGTTSGNLDDVNVAFTPTITTLYTGILPAQGGGIGMRGGYTRGAQIYIKNSNPLPMEILSIMGTLDTADK